MNENLTNLEKTIGYSFRNRGLLDEALTHRSFINEARGGGVADNERLEFFGDAVIDFFLSHLLLKHFPDSREGELSKIRASLVREETLASLASAIDLGSCLKLGRGEEKSGGRGKKSILADGFEALMAAVCLDGGYQSVRRLVEGYFAPLLANRESTETVQDSKSELQELVQPLYGTVPQYCHRKPSGPDHERIFAVEILLSGELLGEGEGRTKKEAEQAAARRALECIRSKLAARPQ